MKREMTLRVTDVPQIILERDYIMIRKPDFEPAANEREYAEAVAVNMEIISKRFVEQLGKMELLSVEQLESLVDCMKDYVFDLEYEAKQIPVETYDDYQQCREYDDYIDRRAYDYNQQRLADEVNLDRSVNQNY